LVARGTPKKTAPCRIPQSVPLPPQQPTRAVSIAPKSAGRPLLGTFLNDDISGAGGLTKTGAAFAGGLRSLRGEETCQPLQLCGVSRSEHVAVKYQQSADKPERYRRDLPAIFHGRQQGEIGVQERLKSSRLYQSPKSNAGYGNANEELQK
jgi:hypothetical protein